MAAVPVFPTGPSAHLQPTGTGCPEEGSGSAGSGTSDATVGAEARRAGETLPEQPARARGGVRVLRIRGAGSRRLRR